MWLFFGACSEISAYTSPGTIIYNFAELSYDDTTTNRKIVANSNTSSVSVGERYSFEVDKTHKLRVDPGVVARFPHTIINSGNTDDSYSFSFDKLDQEAFISPQVILDQNNNGVIDLNEPVIVSTSEMQTEEKVDVIVIARVSPLLSDGAIRNFVFSIVSDRYGHRESVTDTVTVGETGRIEISLETFPTCDVSVPLNDTIIHNIRINKSGHHAIERSRYSIDGTIEFGMIYELAVSDHTGYASVDESSTNTVQGKKVLKLKNSPDNAWISASSLPDDNNSRAQVSHVGYLIPHDKLTVSDVAAFTVELTVSDNSFQTEQFSTFVYTDPDSDRIANEKSNSTCNTLYSVKDIGDGVLRFIEPNSALRESGQVPDLYSNSDFVEAKRFTVRRGDSEWYSAYRDGLYLELKLNTENHNRQDIVLDDSAAQQSVIVTLRSELTEDWLQVVMLETNTPGIFRSLAPVVLTPDIRSGGGICPAIENEKKLVPIYKQSSPTCMMATADNDSLNGLFEDTSIGVDVAAIANVAHQSIIFDTHTRVTVPGAIVQVLRADNNQLLEDSISGDVVEPVSGANGRFTLPRLLDDTFYYLNVIPPLGYTFPSTVLPFRLPGYKVHGFSYGREGIVENNDTSGVFSGAELNARQTFDIPIDLTATGSLLAVEKTAVQRTVDVGQSASYIITIRNSSSENLEEVVLEDFLPFGFRYVAGTTRMANRASADPIRNNAGALEFELGRIAANESLTVSYSLRASAAALDGDGVNTAVATGFTSSRQVTKSLPARARVMLQRSGVMSSKASLFGKVYIDQNCDGLHNNKEWPIGGVRLYLQDGTYAITDGDGQYSLYGLEPGSYVVKIDKYTVPHGLDLKLTAVNQTADPSSHFVDLSEGDFHKVDFATNCPEANAEKIFAELEKRRLSVDSGWFLQQAENFNSLDQRHTDNPQSRMSSADGDVSNGLLDGPDQKNHTERSSNVTRDKANGIPGQAKIKHPDNERATTDAHENSQAEAANSASVSKNNTPIKNINAQEVVATVSSEQAKAGKWLWPQSDISLNGRFMAVVRAGIEPTLYVNDIAVSPSKLGERIVNKREKAQVVAWYGVELSAGENTVEIRGTDPFGNERTLATGIFKRPSAGSQIKLDAQASTIPADGGRSSLPITVQVLDGNGYPALGVYYITLESTKGTWDVVDIQDSEPGLQIRVENGRRTLQYRPSEKTGAVEIRAYTGEFSDELKIHQVAEVRPLLVSGFVEAGGYFSAKNFGNFSPTSKLDSFSTDTQFDSRVALFVKGTVKGNYNLTLSYDSDKTSDQELLRDINPILHYPIHGDASTRGFEAQSRSKLYAKLERNKSSVMWGDYLTAPGSRGEDLAQTNRALTGFNSVLNKGKNTIKVFAAQESNQNISEEIPGNGSSMLYRLKQYPIVSNSEIVELVTRSRENPGLILSSVRLNQLGDYTLDDDQGFLAFSTSIPTLDSDQNPVFIRVTYDVMGDGDSYIVSGVRVDRTVNDMLSIGASHTYNGHETQGTRLTGIYGNFQLRKNTKLSASVASSESIHNTTSGSAYKISIDHQWLNRQAGVTTISRVHADANFQNLAASATAGRTETNIQHSQKLTPTSDARLLLDANSSESAFMIDDRQSVGAMVETHYKKSTVRTGLRHNSLTRESGKTTSVSAIVGLRRKFRLSDKNGESNFQYEQDIGVSRRRRIAVGAKLNLHADVKAYSNYEFTNSLLGINSLTGESESESFIFGMESDKFKSTRLYSEYRVRGAFDSQSYETASGIRGDYVVVDGLKVNPHFEYIRRFGSESDSISASIGIVDTRNQNSKKLLRLETRQSRESDHYGLRASFAARLNLDWTAMVTDSLSRQEIVGANSVLRHAFTAALARRPKNNNKHHMLFMYKLQQEGAVSDGLDRSTHVLSNHQNYQFNQKTRISARLGVKRDNSEFEYNSVTDVTTLVDARVNHEINRRTSFETTLGALSTNSINETRYSMGMGFNYTINKNARVSIGYNIIGFKDRELDIEKYNAKGARIALQYKLDEDLFKWLK